MDENTEDTVGVSSLGEGDIQKIKLKLWKTVQTGIYKSAVEALSLFKDKGGNFHLQSGDHHFKIGGYAADAIRNLDFGSVGEVNLALVSIRQLGFKYRPKYKHVCAAIQKKTRIDFCSGEDFFFSRLSHLETEADERILIPIGTEEDKEGQSLVFRFERHHNSMTNAGRPEYWILRGNGDPNRICELNELFLVRMIDAPSYNNSKEILNMLDVLSELKKAKAV